MPKQSRLFRTLPLPLDSQLPAFYAHLQEVIQRRFAPAKFTYHNNLSTNRTFRTVSNDCLLFYPSFDFRVELNLTLGQQYHYAILFNSHLIADGNSKLADAGGLAGPIADPKSLENLISILQPYFDAWYTK